MANSNKRFITAVDLGSNSFCSRTISVENPNWTNTSFSKITVGLANFINEDKVISSLGIEKAQEAILAIKTQSSPLTRFVIVGTETLRVAKNANQITDFCIRELGVAPCIINGSDEARLMFLGATKSLKNSNKERLIIDIGGASTEFALGNMVPRETLSVKLGCLQMYNKYFVSGIPSYKRWLEASKEVEKELQESLKNFSKAMGKDVEVYGISGTFLGIHKLASIITKPSESVNPKELDKLLVGDIIARLLPKKVHVLYGGTALLAAIANVLKTDCIKPATGDLALGILVEALNPNSKL